MAKSVKGKYLNPKADLTFKLIFNEHPDLVMSLLNALLPLVNEGLSLGDAGPDEFYHDYGIVNVEHSDRIIEGLRFVFIGLKKFKPKTVAEKKMAVLWLRFLTEIDEFTQEVPEELLENADTRKALEIVEKAAYTDGQLLAYDDFWMSVVDERVITEDAQKKGWAKGLAEATIFK